MLKIITATETEGCETRNLTMIFEVEDSINLYEAIKAACQDYCLTEEGKRTYEGNCNAFNWGDFDVYVPDAICQKHGFKKLNSVMAEEYIFDEQLVSETDVFPEEG